jgi:hypothetical protein
MVGILGIAGKGVQVRSCEHRERAVVGYVNNDGITPPVIYVEYLEGASVVSLTNQMIRVSCPACFDSIRQLAKCSPRQ